MSRIIGSLVVTLTLASALVTGGAPAATAAPKMVHDGTATAVTEIAVSMPAGQAYTFETSSLSPSTADPVLHLFAPTGAEVRVDDNSAGGKNARLTYAAPSSATYTLVVRARTNSSAGTATILRSGAVLASGVAFAGWHVPLANVRARESLYTVRLPNGAGPSHTLYVLRPDGLGIEYRASGNGVRGQAQYVWFPSAAASRTVVVGVPFNASRFTRFPPTTGPVRLMRDDAYIADDDADGLGNDLEDELGTCRNATDAAGYFDCARATDPRDTDGDGIRDVWEVRGRSPDQALPLWGADPRHKDLFVEVDFMLRSFSETPMKMQPAEVREFVRVYGDKVGTLTPFLKAVHGASLRNPDGKEGISVHMDTGVGAPASEATLYGNWGGYNAVPPLSEGTGVDYTTAWKTNMAPVRRGIFRYAVPYGSGGGQVGEGMAFTWGLGDARVGVHESGHAMGLQHGGDVGWPNCKPNYPSVESYAGQNDWTVGFSDGLGVPALNNAKLTEYGVGSGSPELLDHAARSGLYVDRASGSVDWNRDGTIAPSGQTVRAFANFGFECEGTRANEVRAGGDTTKSASVTRLGGRTYVFYTEGGALKYTSSTSTFNCPVYAEFGCNGASFSTERAAGISVASGFDVERVKDAATGKDELLVAWADSFGQLNWRRMWLNADGTEAWGVRTVSSTKLAGEPSLARIDAGFSAELAFKGTDGFVRTMRWWGGRFETAQLARDTSGTAIAMHAGASPSVAQVYAPHRPGVKGLYGVFVDAEGRLQLWYRNGTGRWELTAIEGNEDIKVVAGRPSMAWVPSSRSAEYPGRLYVAYQNGAGIVGWVQSYTAVLPSGAREQRMGLNAYFDNSWHTGFGIDLMYEQGVDTNLRAVMPANMDITSLGSANPYKKVLFKPKADGINDLLYRDFDDWSRLRLGLCRNVVNPDGGAPNPIRCP